jgi:hypothetical protein
MHVFKLPVQKKVYFILQSTQQFVKSIQVTYLQAGCISEAKHILNSNGSSSVADSS